MGSGSMCSFVIGGCPAGEAVLPDPDRSCLDYSQPASCVSLWARLIPRMGSMLYAEYGELEIYVDALEGR
jgi:hypothetical protein